LRCPSRGRHEAEQQECPHRLGRLSRRDTDQDEEEVPEQAHRDAARLGNGRVEAGEKEGAADGHHRERTKERHDRVHESLRGSDAEDGAEEDADPRVPAAPPLRFVE